MEITNLSIVTHSRRNQSKSDKELHLSHADASIASTRDTSLTSVHLIALIKTYDVAIDTKPFYIEFPPHQDRLMDQQH